MNEPPFPGDLCEVVRNDIITNYPGSAYEGGGHETGALVISETCLIISTVHDVEGEGHVGVRAEALVVTVRSELGWAVLSSLRVLE